MKKKILLALAIMLLLSALVIGNSLQEKKTERIYIKFNSKVQSKTIQSTILSQINKADIQHIFKDKISAVLTESELKELEKNPNIKIEKVGIRQVLLQNTIGITNATPSYSLKESSMNLTGAGQSVCIIDTGINYTHADFGNCFGANNLSSGCKIWGGIDYCADNSDCLTSDNIPDDVYGHGTHVAGIISANGSIKGIAPDSRIIMIKVCNSTGSCFDDNIIAALQWCTNNASAYNISVISISLGGGLYTSYCNSDVLAPYIDSAVGNNISVVIAAGNDYNKTHISSPACVQSAIPVASSTKTDLVSSFSNRNSIVQLIAPGGTSTGTGACTAGSTDANRICSTSPAGAYIAYSGTSMATPHVAGAIAILNQYLRLVNKTKTPSEIESALNSTGKLIDDSSGSGTSYSRIKIYEAIISFDTNSPRVLLSSPENASTSLVVNQTFTCNATDLALNNATLFIWNSTALYYNLTETISPSSQSHVLSSNLTNMPIGDYFWNCRYEDKNRNIAFSSANFSLSLMNINVILSSPSNNLLTKQNQTFECNFTSNSNLTNATFYLWNSTSSVITTQTQNITNTENTTRFQYNFTSQGEFKWNCLASNQAGNNKFASSNKTITYDATSPNITLNSPLNNSWKNKGEYNITLNENGSCSYSLNNGLNITLDTSNNRNFYSTNSTLTNGSYNLTYNCNDTAGNNAFLSRIEFKIDLIMPNITIISPASGYSATGTRNIDFMFNATDNLNITQCKLIFNNALKSDNTSEIMQNQTNTIRVSVSEGTYTWQINCTDEAGNEINSSTSRLTINAEQSGSSSSSGGGGGSTIITTATFYPTTEELISGYTISLKKGDKIKINLQNKKAVLEEHTIELSEIKTTSVKLTIKSNPINITLEINQTKNINLTSQDYYDLSITLNSIKNNEANLTIKQINELIISKPIDFKENKTDFMIGLNKTDIASKAKEIYSSKAFYIIISIALIIALFFFLKKHNKRGFTKLSKPKIKV